MGKCGFYIRCNWKGRSEVVCCKCASSHSPQIYAYTLVLGTCDCGKWDIADMIKLRTLLWGEYPGLSTWAQCSLSGPCEKNVRRVGGEGDVIRKVGVAVMCFEVGGKTQKPRSTNGL